MNPLGKKVKEYLTAKKMVRVQRDAVIDFFTKKKGGFLGLPAYTESALSPEAKARAEVQGWVIPASDWGRCEVADRSTGNSIDRWVKDRLLPAITTVQDLGITTEMVGIHYEGDNRLVIYRKEA